MAPRGVTDSCQRWVDGAGRGEKAGLRAHMRPCDMLSGSGGNATERLSCVGGGRARRGAKQRLEEKKRELWEFLTRSQRYI